MTRATKWAIGVGVLVLAVIAVLLPGMKTAPQQPAPALNTTQYRADLPGCSEYTGEVSSLDHIMATCLADGSPVELDAMLGGRTTLVNFWATWCQPCQQELPVLEKYAQRSDAVDVLLVQIASPAIDGLDLLAELGVHLPVIHDGDGQTGPVREAFAVPSALPASYLVTADGDFQFIRNPRIFTSVDDVQQAVTAIDPRIRG